MGKWGQGTVWRKPKSEEKSWEEALEEGVKGKGAYISHWAYNVCLSLHPIKLNAAFVFIQNPTTTWVFTSTCLGFHPSYPLTHYYIHPQPLPHWFPSFLHFLFILVKRVFFSSFNFIYQTHLTTQLFIFFFKTSISRNIYIQYLIVLHSTHSSIPKKLQVIVLKLILLIVNDQLVKVSLKF